MNPSIVLIFEAYRVESSQGQEGPGVSQWSTASVQTQILASFISLFLFLRQAPHRNSRSDLSFRFSRVEMPTPATRTGRLERRNWRSSSASSTGQLTFQPCRIVRLRLSPSQRSMRLFCPFIHSFDLTGTFDKVKSPHVPIGMNKVQVFCDWLGHNTRSDASC